MAVKSNGWGGGPLILRQEKKDDAPFRLRASLM
jgi:hypothetical protein